jgi:predicted amidohydrolase YtcJ
MIRLAILLALALASSTFAQAQEMVLYHNGPIYTGDPHNPRVEALLIRGQQVLAVGDVKAVLDDWTAPGIQVRQEDLQGATIIPGLIDAHGHMAGLGAFGLGVLELSSAASFDDITARIRQAAAAKERGEWILGGRWDHESWPSKELPRHAPLSDATPDNPVWLRRVDGHAGLANRRALELAGITRDTTNPDGGEIIKDQHGEPTGILVDNAMRLVESKVPPGARGRGEDLLLKAQELCLAAGLTGVHDMGVSPSDIAVYQRLESEGKLKLRMNLMVNGHHAMRWFESNPPFSGERISVRGCKLYMDGAMGSRGAWLLEPYADRPLDGEGEPYTGLAVSQTDFIEAVARHAIRKHYQVCVHAIGDRGNREVLDAFERAMESEGGVPYSVANRRGLFRIEHAQLLSPEDIPRFARLGIIASMQPTHCTSDMRWVEARVGPDRARGAYAWASLLNTEAVIAAGSDFPVESHNPFLGFYAAITRQNAAGDPEGGWQPQERMTREQALYAMTLGAADAGRAWGSRGSLEVSKLADLVIIDRDIMTCVPKDILETRVFKTIIGGEVVYDAPR